MRPFYWTFLVQPIGIEIGNLCFRYDHVDQRRNSLFSSTDLLFRCRAMSEWVKISGMQLQGCLYPRG